MSLIDFIECLIDKSTVKITNESFEIKLNTIHILEIHVTIQIYLLQIGLQGPEGDVGPIGDFGYPGEDGEIGEMGADGMPVCYKCFPFIFVFS